MSCAGGLAQRHKFTVATLPFSGKVLVMKEPTDKPPEPSPFDAFRSLTSKLVKVPKKEVDRKEVAYKKKRAKKRGEK
jgi:hypothetical protein